MFTKENAAILGAKGGINSGIAKREAAQEQVEIVAETSQISDYEVKTLVRVRLQLDMIFEQFIKEKDPSKLDRLASAQARLSEQERQLAGRPLPGSLRPTSKSSKSSSPKIE